MIITLSDEHGIFKQYRIDKPEDFNEIFSDFPRAEEYAIMAEDMETAAKKICDYISSGHISARIEGGLEKWVKEALIGAGLGAAVATGSPHKAPEQPIQVKQAQAPTSEFGSKPEDTLLWTVKQIESSGGRNVKHPVISHGLSRGDRAIGQWGLLPETIKEFVGRMDRSRQLLPEMQQMKNLKGRSQYVAFFKENPKAELELARAVARHVIRRQKGDSKRAAYAWNHGHNLYHADIADHDLVHSDYVHKFNKYHTINPFAKENKFLDSKKDRRIAHFQKNETSFEERYANWIKERNKAKVHEESRYLPSGNIVKPEEQKKPKNFTEKMKNIIKRVQGND